MDLTWQTVAFDELDRDQLYAVMRLRQQVFVVEQESIYLDLDGRDQGAAHMLVLQGNELVAYQRCLPPGLSYPESALGRIVVAPRARGRDLGRELVRRGIAYNLEQWPQNDICINAQSYLERFYTALGFSAEGEEYMEDGIPHIRMRFKAP
jgi:ElaA protein